MKKILILFALLFFWLVKGQNYPMTQQNNGQTFVTCSGNFYDDGGASGNYSNNVNNRTITFKPQYADRLIRFDFSSFQTEQNYDVLDVFFGPDAIGSPDMSFSGTLGAFSVVSPFAGGSVTFRFKSDSSVNYPGWAATISCVVPCNPPIAVINDDTPDADFCPAEADNSGDFTVTFDASDSFSIDGTAISKYLWKWGDGTTSETTNPVATHTYAGDPGFYTVSLRVRSADIGSDPEGCLSSNIAERRVRILPPPDFSEMPESPIEISCGDSVDLTGIAASQTITQQPIQGGGSDMPLPDTLNTPFESTIDITGFFPAGATVSATCLPEVTFNLEHSYAGDLKIFLIAPSGEEVIIMDGYGGGPGSNNLGKRLFGYCVNNGDGTGPGCPAPYHVVNSGGYNWNAGDAIHSYTESCTAWSDCYSSSQYFKQDKEFNSSQPLTNLIGAELNGVWTLRVVDYWGIDDGYMDGWVISFPGNCYIDLDAETPILDGGGWTHDGDGPQVPTNQTIIDEPHETDGIDECPGDVDCIGNKLTNTITVGPFTEQGTYIYTFNITDEYGCEYTKDVEIIVGEKDVEIDIQNFYCVDAIPEDLPSVSDNGVSGTWFPSTIDTSDPGIFEYTFTPDEGQCAQPVSVEVEVKEWETATFNLPTLICEGSEPIFLPGTSLEGYAGSWSPPLINPGTSGTYTYIFTPNDECVEPVELVVEVVENLIPTFDPVDPICLGTDAPDLPEPNEGITGTWFPASIDTSALGTFTFTFTPDGDCGEEATIEITVTDSIEPNFNSLQLIYCEGDDTVTLPEISDNGITGTWIPAIINANVPGTGTYTFYPDEDQCSDAKEFVIEIMESLKLIPQNVQIVCDDNFDGIYTTNLNALNPHLSTEQGVSYKYYASLENANNGVAIPASQLNNYILTGPFPMSVYVVGMPASGCESDSMEIVFDIGEEAVHNPGPYTIEYCQEDPIDLTQLEGIISNSNVDFGYYHSIQNAQNQTGQINNIGEYNPSSNNEIIIVRIDQDGRCAAIVQIALSELPAPDLMLSDTVVAICDGDSVEVTATSSDPNASFEWTSEDGTVLYGEVVEVSEIGTYTIVAFSADGCRSEERTLEVTHPSLPIIIGVEFGETTVTVVAEGDGILEYSLDGILWQDNNIFYDLIPGQTYTVWVRSSGCMAESYTFTLVHIPNFISPNNDGINDTWSVRGITGGGAIIKIFDRYGKIFVHTNFNENYEWNGKYLGNNVPSGDYWYIITVPSESEEIPDQTFVGHISVRSQ